MPSGPNQLQIYCFETSAKIEKESGKKTSTCSLVSLNFSLITSEEMSRFSKACIYLVIKCQYILQYQYAASLIVQHNFQLFRTGICWVRDKSLYLSAWGPRYTSQIQCQFSSQIFLFSPLTNAKLFDLRIPDPCYFLESTSNCMAFLKLSFTSSYQWR
jgi:hypothetical protein